MAKNYFADASKARVQITNTQVRAIRSMYKDLAEEIAEESARLSTRTNISSIMRRQYLANLSRQINKELDDIGKMQGSTIRANMQAVAAAIVKDNVFLLNKMGVNATAAYSHIPSDIVKEVASGQLYKGRWTLNSAIWGNTAKTKQDINTVIAKGIAGQKSTYEIAKDLEQYVNPLKRKDWDWSKVYPGTNKVVDYNAQRLARTMVSHAYQDAFVRTTKDNPFIDSYRWLASGGDRMCEVCAERDGKIFEKDELPLDHPNGMCTFEAVISKSFNQIGEELADWVNGENHPELDNFAESLGYTPITLKSKVSK